MARHRSYSIEFKRQVTQEFLGGETLYGLAKRHDVSRNLIRIWVAKYEAGAFDDERHPNLADGEDEVELSGAGPGHDEVRRGGRRRFVAETEDDRARRDEREAAARRGDQHSCGHERHELPSAGRAEAPDGGRREQGRDHPDAVDDRDEHADEGRLDAETVPNLGRRGGHRIGGHGGESPERQGRDEPHPRTGTRTGGPARPWRRSRHRAPDARGRAQD